MCSSNKAAKVSYYQGLKAQQFNEQQAAKAEADERQRQENIKQGLSSIDSQFSKFDPAYYQGISSSYYNDYAKPQLDQTQQQTTDKTRFGLARAGLLQSSAGAKEFGDLSQVFSQARVDAQNRGLELANNQKANVESNRNSLVSQLYASENPEVALQSSQRAVAGLSSPTSLPVITDILASAAQFAQRDYLNAQYGYGGNGLTSGLYNRGTSSANGSARTIN